MLISFSSIQLSDDDGRRESNFPFSHYTFNELCESLWSISSYGVTKHIFLSVSCNIVHMMKRATTRQATTTTMWREISIQYWNSSENRTPMMTRRRNSFLVDGIKEYIFFQFQHAPKFSRLHFSGWDYGSVFRSLSFPSSDDRDHRITMGPYDCDVEWGRALGLRSESEKCGKKRINAERRKKNELGRLSVIWLGAQGLTWSFSHTQKMTLDNNTSESRKTESKSEQKNYVNLAPARNPETHNNRRMINEKFYGYGIVW